ncbi:MAG: hypothetical protein LBP22_02215 [Deltaproteobacteria bacterium]|jgi:hypothetical protein|nr:hypothetical protein [Deltaproteobacteria bacterium]
MIRNRPQNFLGPQAAVCLYSNIRKVDLHSLEPLPVLFHSGDLAIDKEIFTDSKPLTPNGRPIKLTSCTFKFPNFEVAEWVTNVLSAVSFCQHTPDESFYHVTLQGCLISGGLMVLAELAEAMGRSDIIVGRPSERYLIIELRYRKKEEGHTESDLKNEPAKASREALTHVCQGHYRKIL